MVALNVLTRTSSRFVSAPTIARKRGGEFRFCVDYTRLNSMTVPVPYPLPSISELHRSFVGQTFFAAFDLSQGFHQISVTPRTRDLLAFQTVDGVFTFLRMPFGPRNAPAHFQRVMQEAVIDLPGVQVYVDDVALMAETFDAFLSRLDAFLKRCRQLNVRISPKKSVIGVPELQYLGMLVSRYGVSMDPDRLLPIRELQEPQSKKELASVLGLFNYLRQYVPHYATLIAPLQALVRKTVPFIWGPSHSAAFQEVKRLLLNAPVLALPVPGYPLVLRTDASTVGVGSVLTQRFPTPEEAASYPGAQQALQLAVSDSSSHPRQSSVSAPSSSSSSASSSIDDHSRMINQHRRGDVAQHADVPALPANERLLAFFSHVLTPAETRYSVTDLEALAIVRSLAKFGPLIRDTIIIITDHVNLLYLTASKSARVRRWAAFIAQYPCTFVYSPGATNVVADHLSRHPIDTLPLLSRARSLIELPPTIRHPDLSARCPDLPTLPPDVAESSSPTSSSSLSSSAIQLISAQPESKVASESAAASRLVDRFDEDQRAMQAADAATVHSLDRTSTLPVHDMLRDIPHVVTSSGRWRFDTPLPDTVVARLFAIAHEFSFSGHLGARRTLMRLRSVISWPSMAQQIKRLVEVCPPCQKERARTLQAPMIGDTRKHFPFQCLVLDVWQHLPKVDGYEHALVVVCRYSRWVAMMPLKDLRAESVARALFFQWICVYGAPYEIVSDGGRSFDNTLLKSVAELLDTSFHITTAYHPQSHGSVERYIGVAAAMIRANIRRAEKWTDLLQPTCLAMNTAINLETGVSPYRAIHGFSPRTPLHSALRIQYDAPEPVVHAATLLREITSLRSKIFEAQQRACEQERQRYKKSLRRPAQLQPGNFVLWRRPRDSKLVHNFQGPYVVVAVIPEPRKGIVRIRSLQPRPREYEVHVSDLAVFHPGHLTADELRREAAPADEYYVESVLDHHVVNGVTYFLIKWEFYPQPDPMDASAWLRWSDLGDEVHVVEYARRHGLRRLRGDRPQRRRAFTRDAPPPSGDSSASTSSASSSSASSLPRTRSRRSPQ
jgi:hypothetical protein